MKRGVMGLGLLWLLLSQSGFAQGKLVAEMARIQRDVESGKLEFRDVYGIPYLHVNETLDVAILPMSFFYEFEEIRKVSGPEFYGEQLSVGQPFKMEFRARWRKKIRPLSRGFDRFLRRYSSPGSKRTMIILFIDHFRVMVNDGLVVPANKLSYVSQNFELGDVTPDYFTLGGKMEIVENSRKHRSSVFRSTTEFQSLPLTTMIKGESHSYSSVSVHGKVIVNAKTHRILKAVSDVHFDMYLTALSQRANQSEALFLNDEASLIGKAQLLPSIEFSGKKYPLPPPSDLLFLVMESWDQNIARSGMGEDEWMFREHDRIILNMVSRPPSLRMSLEP